MTGTRTKTAVFLGGLLALSVASVAAFDSVNTGDRTFNADVVSDANAFVALEENGNSDHTTFVSTDGANKIQVNLDSSASPTGTGVNPDSVYRLDSLVNVTNQAHKDLTVSVTFTGADSGQCEAALTSSSSQSSGDYASSPSLSITKDSQAYLGLKFDASSKTDGDALDCTAKLEA